MLWSSGLRKERAMPVELKDVTDIDVAFGGGAMHLLPKWEEIPDEFKRQNNKWVKVVSDWFFSGLRNAKWTPKAGVDERKALRMVKVCMGSFEPAHEHKEAGCAFMLSEFFEDVKYETGK